MHLAFLGRKRENVLLRKRPSRMSFVVRDALDIVWIRVGG
jgi:hypothetical protein